MGDEFEIGDDGGDIVGESWPLLATCEVDVKDEVEDGLVAEVLRPVLFERVSVADDRGIERLFGVDGRKANSSRGKVIRGASLANIRLLESLEGEKRGSSAN